MYTEDIGGIHYVLLLQGEMIVMQYPHMDKRTTLCVERNGGHVKGNMVHSFKFHVNKQTIIYLCNRFC